MDHAPTRRDFLGGAFAGALLGLPGGPLQILEPPAGSGAAGDEDFWNEIRRDQFYLPAWRGYLNNGSLGVCPRPVVRAVIDSVLSAARREDFGKYPRWGYEECTELRGKLAGFVGTRTEKVALTHNATHAMYLVADGMALREGDEVLLTDQEHPTCNGTWDQEAARRGIEVQRVPIPLAPADPGDITQALLAAVTPRTRALVFSEILTTTGARLPVAEICAAAREQGVLTVVDGAHCPGQVPLALDELGCDAYCASPHKWLLAPAGSGFLALRSEFMESQLPWCANGSHWWNRKDLHAARFMGLGTNNDCTLDGLGAALDWYEKIGPGRIYARQHALARSVLARAQELPGVDLATADDDAQFAAMVCFGVKGLDLEATDRLLRERGLWTARVGSRYRVSCHVHVRPRDLDAFFEVLDEQIRRQGL